MEKKIIEPKILKGFRDFLPESMKIRNQVKKILVNVFESWGFEPLETPTLEYQDILLGKYGEEADKLVYKFEDNGGRAVAMKYDLTVPASRVMAQYQNDLPRPFKRYQIQRVWRADKPQFGRYREIEMCDIDIFGSESIYSDAEIPLIIYDILRKLNFEEFEIKINSRDILFEIIKTSGIDWEKRLDVISTIDKLDKKSEEEVKLELKEKGFDQKSIDLVFNSLNNVKPNERLSRTFDILMKSGVPERSIKFEPSLARGLDYYTGIIFETKVSKPKIGSITGGGRYDNLVGLFTGMNIPAVGTTVGLDRIIDVIIDNNLWENQNRSIADVMFINFEETVDETMKIAGILREREKNVLIYPDNIPIGKQFKYADKKGIPYVVVIGPDEVAQNIVQIKDMRTGDSKKGKLEDILKVLE